MIIRPDRIRARKVPTKTAAKVTVKRIHRQIATLKLMLRSLGLEFVEEHRFHETRMWRFDLAVPALKLAIEYQGHGTTGKTGHVGGHGSVTGLAKDCEKDFAAVLAGWRVLKFTALHFTPAKCRELKLTSPLEAIRAMAGQASGGQDESRRIAGELIAAIRINTMRGTFATATLEEVDQWLKQWTDKFGPNPVVGNENVPSVAVGRERPSAEA